MSTDEGPKLSSTPSLHHRLPKDRISSIPPSHLHCPLLCSHQCSKKKTKHNTRDNGQTATSDVIQTANWSTYYSLSCLRTGQIHHPFITPTWLQLCAKCRKKLPLFSLFSKKYFKPKNYLNALKKLFKGFFLYAVCHVRQITDIVTTFSVNPPFTSE